MSDLQAAVAAGVFGAEDGYRALLRATVEVARAIFHAKAASVFLLDEETEELVFEAVPGEGADPVVRQPFPADTGVPRWGVVTRRPAVRGDPSHHPPLLAR